MLSALFNFIFGGCFHEWSNWVAFSQWEVHYQKRQCLKCGKTQEEYLN